MRRTKEFILVCISLALIACACAVAQCQQPAAVCRVRNGHSNGSEYGSGTLIGQDEEGGVVITCSHLFRDGVGQVSCCFGSNGCYLAKVIGRDDTFDLAALRVGKIPVTPVVLAEQYPPQGQVVIFGGFGRTGRYQAGRSKVIGYVTPQQVNRAEWVQIEGASQDGDSGGPIFNERGELVGVLWGTDQRRIIGSYCGRVRVFLQTCCPGLFRGRQPHTVVVPMTPIVKPPAPTIAPAPIYATEVDCQARFETLQAQIDAMRLNITEMQRQIAKAQADIINQIEINNQPPAPPIPPAPETTPTTDQPCCPIPQKGDKGDKGDRGEKGDKGDKGDPGTAAQVDLNELTQEVLNRLPPITMVSSDESNTYWGPVEVHLGQTVRLPGFGVRHREKVPVKDDEGKITGFTNGQEATENVHLGDILTINEYTRDVVGSH